MRSKLFSGEQANSKAFISLENKIYVGMHERKGIPTLPPNQPTNLYIGIFGSECG